MALVSGSLAIVEEYDPTSDVWTTRAPMPSPRQYLAAATQTGKLYAIGGFGGQSSSAVDQYEPAVDTWSTMAPMSTGRYGHACAVVNGRIYVMGGEGGRNALDEFQPWAALAPMLTERYFLTAAAVELGSGKVYAIGGTTGSALATNEEFVASHARWDVASR